MNKILLDLDGVVINLIKGVCKLFNRDYNAVVASWPPGTYNLEDVLNITTEELFTTIESDPHFWANLEPYPWADELFNELNKIAPVIICTRPTYDPNCFHGKMRWIHDWKGRNYKDFVLTPKKELLAKKGYVLIDDYDQNVERFNLAGGHGLLFPAINNSRHYAKDNAINLILEETRYILNNSINKSHNEV